MKKTLLEHLQELNDSYSEQVEDNTISLSVKEKYKASFIKCLLNKVESEELLA